MNGRLGGLYRSVEVPPWDGRCERRRGVVRWLGSTAAGERAGVCFGTGRFSRRHDPTRQEVETVLITRSRVHVGMRQVHVGRRSAVALVATVVALVFAGVALANEVGNYQWDSNYGTRATVAR